MKAKELVRELVKLPGDVEIVLSRDSEGNSYGTVQHRDNGMSSICPVVTKQDMEKFGIKKPMIILYPWKEHLELGEI